eukprot:Selendium_serpulae@DN3985_c0_g1_i1.p2
MDLFSSFTNHELEELELDPRRFFFPFIRKSSKRALQTEGCIYSQSQRKNEINRRLPYLLVLSMLVGMGAHNSTQILAKARLTSLGLLVVLLRSPVWLLLGG